MDKYKRFLAAILLLVGLLPFAVLGQAHGQGQEVPQGYGSDQTLQKGLIVALKKGTNNKVEALNQSNINAMYGVVVSANDSPVNLSDNNSGTQVYVATAGNYDVLVSTQNGPIANGDYITISALDGVGMKTGDSQSFVIGKALQSFDGHSGTESTAQLTDSNGNKMLVSLARISVSVGVARNPSLKVTVSNLPSFLQKAAQAVANKPVTDSRIYISLVALVACMLIAGSLLYAGVRSSITAVGRNPLAKTSIAKGLVQVSVLALIIFLLGIFAVYLLLKL
ncbi:MAG TPA: hypothetical protein VJR27_00965 [Candidatus Saccharimonadales bacterium]|nr:hypothetical protein [Candidatus Saccharimonadales bacterium]